MRYVVLVFTVACAIVGGVAGAAPPKTPPPDVGAGRVAWFDLTTTDLVRSKEFYGKLFDWKFAALEGTDQAFEIVAGGKAIGTLRTARANAS